MPFRIVFVLASLYVVSASVIPVNVYDDEPETEVVLKQGDCNLQACEQLCRRLGFPGGACVNGRCKCDNFYYTEVEVARTPESLSNLEEPDTLRACSNRKCNQFCKRAGFTRGGCYKGRCRCTLVRGRVENRSSINDTNSDKVEESYLVLKTDEVEFSGTPELLSNLEEPNTLRACSNQKCNQFCRRAGFTRGGCYNGRCRCTLVRRQNENPSLLNDTTSDEVEENYLTLRPDEVEFARTPESLSNLEEPDTLRACSNRQCNQFCRRAGFTRGSCYNGRCRCTLVRHQAENNFLINDTPNNEVEESYLVFTADEAETPGTPESLSNADGIVPARKACTVRDCAWFCRRIGFSAGTCINGRCKCRRSPKSGNPFSINDTTNDEVEESYLVLKTDEEELELP